MTNKQIIIDFILNEHYQIIIEGHYSVRAIYTTGNGKTLDEALQNWYEKYQKNINNLEWRQNYGFEYIPHKHLEQF